MIIKRITTIKCDGSMCGDTVDVEHDLEFESDAGYALNQAIDKAGWADVWLDDVRGYGHLCPACGKKRAGKLLEDLRRREAKDKKKRGHA